MIINPVIQQRNSGLLDTSLKNARMEFISHISGPVNESFSSFFSYDWISVFVYPETLLTFIQCARMKYRKKEIYWIFSDKKFTKEKQNLSYADLRTRKFHILPNQPLFVFSPFFSLENIGVFQSLCDANIVRGENSLCQALISGKPVLWDIYKEKNDAHLEKIEDSLGFLRSFFSEDTFNEYARIFREFNSGAKDTALLDFFETTEEFQSGFEKIGEYVRGKCDLVEKLEKILEE